MAALARQWFGVFMRPRAPADAWLLTGLAGWLEGHFVRTFQGANELSYRCVSRSAIFTPASTAAARRTSNLLHFEKVSSLPTLTADSDWRSSICAVDTGQEREALDDGRRCRSGFSKLSIWTTSFTPISHSMLCSLGGARSGKQYSLSMTAWRRRSACWGRPPAPGAVCRAPKASTPPACSPGRPQRYENDPQKRSS